MACRLLQAELQALHETLGGIIAGLGVYIEGPECASQVKVKMYKEQKSKDVDKAVPALIDRLASFGFFHCLRSEAAVVIHGHIRVNGCFYALMSY